MTVTFDGPIALGASRAVRGAWQTATRNTFDRIELSASFADWAHLRGSICAVHYTYSGRRPADPDTPGRAAAIRCDSGTTTFASELVPGSWPEVAESHGG